MRETHLVPTEFEEDVRVVGVFEEVLELHDVPVLERFVDLDLRCELHHMCL